jgi:hypothetical protein
MRGEDMSYPILAFHGTKEENIAPIVEGGFKVPGKYAIVFLHALLVFDF